MFRGLINDAKSAVSSVIIKYLARASVAVPFVIGAGFALAAGTVMLVERYGQIFAYWSMAGGLAAVGLVAALFVREKEQEEEVADQKAEAHDTAEVASEVAAQAPLALLGGLFSLPGGPSTALKIMKVLGNNYALVLLLVAIGAILWPTGDKSSEPAPGVVEPLVPVPLSENVVALAEERQIRSGSRGFATAFVLALIIALFMAAGYLVDPETKRAVIARMSW